MKNTKLITVYFNTLTMIANQTDGEIRRVFLEVLRKFGMDCNIGNYNFALLCSTGADLNDLKTVISNELNINFDTL